MLKIKLKTLLSFASSLFLVWALVFGQVDFSIKVFAGCGGGTCDASACGLVTLDYGGYFPARITIQYDLHCTYDPECVNNTVPCTADQPYGNNDLGICFDDGATDGCIGNQYCYIEETPVQEPASCFHNHVKVLCGGGCPPVVQPTSPPADGDPATSTTVPTTVPTTPPLTFQGSFYNDSAAIASGIGGTDNLCTGSTTEAVPIGIAMPGTSIKATRSSGETQTGSIGASNYSITTSTSNSDYTITLQLPFPPPDPNNAWQCACNADPADPYRCLYTNQQPSTATAFNFFLKQANVAETAWFQTLGGSSWAANSIESLIPASTCTPPTCTPALIASDRSGTADSAGFPLTQNGSIITSITGETYIHETAARTTAVQGQATGVTVPTENYDYFYEKLDDQIQTLASSDKPIVGTDLEVFEYSGNLTIDENSPWNLSNTEQMVVFVDGDLTIDDTVAGENRLITVAEGGNAFLMFVVSGDITVTSNVGYADIYTDATQADISNVDGVFVADGLLIIDGVANTTDRKFIGAGTFVGWSGVELNRNFDNGSDPTLNDNAATETFIFRPDFIVNAPKAVKSAQMTWREIEPSF